MVDVPVRGASPDSVTTRRDVLTRFAVTAVDRLGNESSKILKGIPSVE
jgi:hypothetical protein